MHSLYCAKTLFNFYEAQIILLQNAVESVLQLLQSDIRLGQFRPALKMH